MKKKWIQAIRRDEGKDLKISDSTKVCSRHFRDEDLRACLHGDGGPQPWSKNKTRLYAILQPQGAGVRAGLPGRVTLSAGATICHVNVSRWGYPPSRGHVNGRKLKSETCVF